MTSLTTLISQVSVRRTSAALAVCLMIFFSAAQAQQVDADQLAKAHADLAHCLQNTTEEMLDKKLRLCFGAAYDECAGDQPYVERCWWLEQQIWDTAAHNYLQSTVAETSERIGPEFGKSILDSQRIWEESRRLDCAIELSQPYFADGGEAACLARRSMERVEFLEIIRMNAEFDG